MTKEVNREYIDDGLTVDCHGHVATLTNNSVFGPYIKRTIPFKDPISIEQAGRTMIVECGQTPEESLHEWRVLTAILTEFDPEFFKNEVVPLEADECARQES